MVEVPYTSIERRDAKKDSTMTTNVLNVIVEHYKYLESETLNYISTRPT